MAQTPPKATEALVVDLIKILVTSKGMVIDEQEGLPTEQPLLAKHKAKALIEEHTRVDPAVVDTW